MSYDVYAGEGDHNITSNLRQFFQDFDVYPPGWDGMLRHDVADKIDAALQAIGESLLEALKAKYDAPNGWGLVEHGIRFLENVRDSCRYEVPERVRVSW